MEEESTVPWRNVLDSRLRLQEAKTELERKRREKSDTLQYVDSSGLYADFHALRHSYVSLITQGGVHP